jgi:hypothetical protein
MKDSSDVGAESGVVHMKAWSCTKWHITVWAVVLNTDLLVPCILHTDLLGFHSLLGVFVQKSVFLTGSVPLEIFLDTLPLVKLSVDDTAQKVSSTQSLYCREVVLPSVLQCKT